jgi:hypothetical protein
MADLKISALTASTTPLTGTEVLPIVQSSTTKQVSVANLTAGRAVSATSLTANVVYTTALAASPATTTQNLYIYSSGGLNANAGIEWQYSASGSGYGFKQNVNGGTDTWDVGYRANANTWTRAFAVGNTGVITMPAYGAGSATFSAAGVISSVSDETFKIKDGAPTDPDEMLKKLTPGYWFYDQEKTKSGDDKRQLGFYAQNVHEAIGPEAAPEPEEVVDVSEDGTITKTGVFRPWGYYDRSVLAVTVMSLQNAMAKIETLEARILALETKNSA